MQGSLLAEVHVDVGGEQIVHFVTLSREETDGNKADEKDKPARLYSPEKFHTGISSPSPNCQ